MSSSCPAPNRAVALLSHGEWLLSRRQCSWHGEGKENISYSDKNCFPLILSIMCVALCTLTCKRFSHSYGKRKTTSTPHLLYWPTDSEDLWNDRVIITSCVCAAGRDGVQWWQNHRADEESQRADASRSPEAKEGEQKEAIAHLFGCVCLCDVVGQYQHSLTTCVYINIWLLRHFHVSLHFGGKCHRPSMFLVSLISLAAFNAFYK